MAPEGPEQRQEAAFSGQVRSLQLRLAEVRAQRQALHGAVAQAPLPHLGAAAAIDCSLAQARSRAEAYTDRAKTSLENRLKNSDPGKSVAKHQEDRDVHYVHELSDAQSTLGNHACDSTVEPSNTSSMGHGSTSSVYSSKSKLTNTGDLDSNSLPANTQSRIDGNSNCTTTSVGPESVSMPVRYPPTIPCNREKPEESPTHSEQLAGMPRLQQSSIWVDGDGHVTGPAHRSGAVVGSAGPRPLLCPLRTSRTDSPKHCKPASRLCEETKPCGTARVSLDTDGPLYGSPATEAKKCTARCYSDADLLRSENNLLTERLVEASMESAQHLEALSSSHDELRRTVHRLRSELEEETAKRSSCETQLKAAEQAIKDLQENGSGAAGSETVFADGIDSVRELQRLRERAQCHAAEKQQLRELVEKRTLEANATIMELAQRNKDLEAQLQTLHGLLNVQRLQSSSGHQTPPLSASNPARSASAERLQRVSSAQSLRSVSSDGRMKATRSSNQHCSPNPVSINAAQGSLLDRSGVVRSGSSPPGRRCSLGRSSSQGRRAQATTALPETHAACRSSSKPRADELQASFDRLAEEMRHLQRQVLVYNST